MTSSKQKGDWDQFHDSREKTYRGDNEGFTLGGVKDHLSSPPCSTLRSREGLQGKRIQLLRSVGGWSSIRKGH